MSLYHQNVQDLLSEALNAMKSRRDVFPTLANLVNETPGLGIESWFQTELLLHFTLKGWKICKIQTPYDLEATINEETLKIELKAVTANDFKERVIGWYYPKEETKNYSREELTEERKDALILFLSLQEAFKKANIDTEKLLNPIISHIDNDWLVGIIKRND